jgi:hypothetical protein
VGVGVQHDVGARLGPYEVAVVAQAAAAWLALIDRREAHVLLLVRTGDAALSVEGEGGAYSDEPHLRALRVARERALGFERRFVGHRPHRAPPVS